MRDLFVIILVFIMLVFVVYFTNNYNKLFQPSRKIAKYVEQPSEEVVINGVSISAFWNDKSSKTILFCHGNFGNITQRNYAIKFVKTNNLNLILFDYFGFGKSSGLPSTRKILSNAETVLDWTLEKVKQENLIIWGESLGGSTASYLSSKHKCDRLILFSTFSSLDDLAFGKFSHNKYIKPIKLFFGFMINLLPTKEWVKNSNCNVLVIHSEEDKLIPFSLAQEIQNQDISRIELMKIKGGHTTPILTEDQYIKLVEFCGKTIQNKEYIGKIIKEFESLEENEDW
jgi:pimeloyl-ACP methyl ester carboxylesterase